MTSAAPFSFVIALVTAVVGLVGGLVYFRGLRLAVDLFTRGRSWRWALGLTFARVVGMFGVLLLVVQLGPAPLTTCFVGFLLARVIALRSASEAR